MLLLCLFTTEVWPNPNWDLTLTEAEWATSDIIRIPFTLTGTLITVRAKVDTTEGNFFFDTGSSDLLLNYRHFRTQAGSATTAGGGVTGKVRVLGSIRMDTLVLDNLVATDISAQLLDLSHIENAKKTDLVGIIGYEVFKDYEVLFDYASFRLVLIRTDRRGNPITPLPDWEYQARESFPLDVAGHVAVVKVKFAAAPGLRFASIRAPSKFAEQFRRRPFLKDNFEIGKRTKLHGAGRKSVEVLSGKLLNARLDSLRWPMATILTNLSEINSTYQTDVDGILGYEFLSQRPVAISI